MRLLQARAEEAARREVARVKRRIAERIDVQGVAVAESEAGIVLSGRGLLRRVLTDERLRWIGGLFR